MRGKTLIRDNKDTLLLIFILLLGTILRIYRLQDIPFTHDEFSALFRTRFDNFADLIALGVRNDGHPAGVQVFLYYWIRIFGDGEVAVKIPFILSGILSIYFIFRVGKEWFNTLVGLAAAAFVACMEYTIMYSQITRPYASGLLFVLIMVYAWSRYLFRPGKQALFYLGIYIIASALCAYNHYFSMFFAVIVGLSGLVFLKRRSYIHYLGALFIIVILFLPHFSISLNQFQIGGVGGWLGKPSNDFILRYIAYLFHFAWPVYTLVIAIVLLGILNWERPHFHKNKFHYLSAAWFLFPFLAGFFYSRYVDSVLQFSVLIFSFPWFLLLVLGMMPDWQGWRKPVIVALISITLFVSLITERQYYDLFYRDRFREFIVETDQTLQKYGKDNCMVIMDSHKKISNHYYESLGISFDHIHYGDLKDTREFARILENSTTDYLSIACDSESDLVLPNIVRNYYPRMLKKIDYYGGNYYVFSRDSFDIDEFYFMFRNDFDRKARFWSQGQASSYIDTIGMNDSSSYLMDSEQEFGPEFSRKVRSVLVHKNDIIDISVSVRDIDSVNNSLLVTVLNNNKGQVVWTASHFNWYGHAGDGWYRVYHTFRPAMDFDKKGLTLKIYIWNKDLNTYLIDDFRIDCRPGNRGLFGLLEEI